MSNLRKIKVLFLVDKTGFGGVQTIASDLIDSMDKFENIEMNFFYLRDIDKTFGTVKKDSRFVHYSKSKFKYSLTSLVELIKLIRRLDIDILHLNGDKALILGVIVKKMFSDIKIIHHEHGPIFQNKKWYDLLLKCTKRSIDKYIAVSEATKNLLVGKIGITLDEIFFVNNFVDFSVYNFDRCNGREKLLKKYGVFNEYVIGFVGRLNEVKGCIYLINALEGLDINFKVIIAGDGPERKMLESRVNKLGFQDRVIFTGYVEDVVCLYTIFDVLVVPSRSESFGLSIVESLAMNTPVIGSSIPAIQELINKENGVLFKKEDVSDLKKCILVMHRRSLDTRKKKDFRGELLKRYSLEQYLKNLISVYEELC